ncbi:UNKNOWN [Stylonychia lemnae]|uniref:Uncharacterized protein n=1 Tax=Stylonychia lemnae TaxID=5949 RepID=A0A077ZYI5_STYLE|nr:UNKNOWN [Stylonychia lemnae]|eukprot:CDW75006.1 UNKNOWN [Stylonychia lemnae]
METDFKQIILDETLAKDNDEFQREKEIVMDRIRRKIQEEQDKKRREYQVQIDKEQEERKQKDEIRRQHRLQELQKNQQMFGIHTEDAASTRQHNHTLGQQQYRNMRSASVQWQNIQDYQKKQRESAYSAYQPNLNVDPEIQIIEQQRLQQQRQREEEIRKQQKVQVEQKQKKEQLQQNNGKLSKQDKKGNENTQNRTINLEDRNKGKDLQNNAQTENQIEEEEAIDYSTWKTFVSIPYEPAPPDPIWMQKKQAGKRLNIQEKKEMMEYEFNKSHNELQKRNLKVPSRATFVQVMDEYHTLKTQCLISHSCAGKNYPVYDGIFDRCGKMNPFIQWEKYVSDKKSSDDVTQFMLHYNIQPFQAPQKAQTTLNAFFQAKYGMFYCYDNNKNYGMIDYDPELIQRWEKTPRQLKRTWTMAVMSAVSDGSISWEDIKCYRVRFEDTKRWRNFEDRQFNRKVTHQNRHSSE